ncbi:phosphoribosylamine--glycine ligase [Terriglobus sp.]|uniref:phosphoribosylamine--glycine ligase n=1 Tax=Terriglobus sp. TaxID=1889013 RepID=UPI003B0073B5
MRVLVIGGGGREHALCWALQKSARVSELFCAPGNAGIATIATCVPVEQTSVLDMLRVVHQVAPELVVIGPEVPLGVGIVDALNGEGVRVFGPTQAAARLESSKSFAKSFMQRHGIATAQYQVCSSVEEVAAALPAFAMPVVVKADGLAAGKGVVIAETGAEAEQAAAELLALGGTLVLEKFLEGEELSFFALCDGNTAVPIAAAQDHKRLLDGDRGPNTGGMGAYSTDELLPNSLRQALLREVAQRAVDGMREEGTPFRGILFCGMMLTARGPMVLEFNTRWGDPETEAILVRMETDLLDLVEASINGTAGDLAVRMRPGASACVIAASAGYPAAPRKGDVISGLEQPLPEATVIFHAGTAATPTDVVTAGGRVLAVTAAAATLDDALFRAYQVLDRVHFEGMQFRRDIGFRALTKR